MTIQEMKKIWRPGMVLLLSVLSVVYYTMFLQHEIEYFPDGAQNEGILLAGKELVQSYGTSISAEEMAAYEKKLPALQKEADRYVRESRIGKKYGITDYEEYAAFCSSANAQAYAQGDYADQNEAYADFMRLRGYLQGAETGNIEGRLYGAAWMSAAYRAMETYGADLNSETYAPKEKAHVQKAFFKDGNLWQNVLPFEVPKAASTYLGNLLVWICISVCLLLAPLLVHDRMSRMPALQYSSKRGRGIYASQLAAVMLTAFFVTTGYLAVFGSCFFTRGTAVFFPCKMYSFAVMQFCLPNWTHGTWCLVLAAICYLMAFGTAGIVFFLSGKCANDIAMLLKVLPLAVAAALLSPKMIKDAFYFDNILYRVSGVPYIELLCALAVFAAGMALCLLGKRQVENKQHMVLSIMQFF